MEAALWGGILLTAAWCNDTILMRSATSEHGEGRPMTDVRFAVDMLQRFVVSPGPEDSRATAMDEWRASGTGQVSAQENRPDWCTEHLALAENGINAAIFGKQPWSDTRTR